MTTTTTTTISHPNEYDVLCGKDSSCMIRHTGNRIFRERIDLHKDTYQFLSRHEKMVVTKDIVQLLQSTYGTRFLKKKASSATTTKSEPKDDDADNNDNDNDDNSCWVELSGDKVRDKVGHALRFAASRGVKQQSPKARRRVSPDSSVQNKDSTGDDSAKTARATTHKKANSSNRHHYRAADSAAALPRPTIHLNNLLPAHFSSVISDQLADIINSRNSNNKADKQQGLEVNKQRHRQQPEQEEEISSRTSAPPVDHRHAHAHAHDHLNAAPVSNNANTAYTTFKNETTTIAASCLALDNGGCDDTAFAEEMFQRQQAIFSAMSIETNNNDPRKRTPAASAAASAAWPIVVAKTAAAGVTVTTTRLTPPAEPLARRESSEWLSQSLWHHLLSAPMLEEEV